MHKVNIEVDGVVLEVPAGISVAAAVLGHKHDNHHEHGHVHNSANGHKAFYYNEMDASPRAPYCLMGVCFECMMEIDGEENVQSCLVEVREGMKIKRQQKKAPFAFEEDIAVMAEKMTEQVIELVPENSTINNFSHNSQEN